jgi:hypothetical protein
VALTFTLAKETGWTENFILWELPMSRALQYYHAALWSNGAWTVPPREAPRAELEQLFQAFDNLSESDD